jgi:hypothetical protein
MKIYSLVPILTCTLLAVAFSSDDSGYARAQEPEHAASNWAPQDGVSDNKTAGSAEKASTTQPAGPSLDSQNAGIFTFGVLSQSPVDETKLSAKACQDASRVAAVQANQASTRTAKPAAPLNVDPKILASITDELHKKLSKKMSVTVDAEPIGISIGSLVITGCITRINAGSGVERMAGMNLGASRVGAHVLVLSKTRTGFNPIDGFDIQVKGGDPLPPIGPIGLAIHAAREPGQTLSADGKKLADQILKKLGKDTTVSKSAYVIPPPLFTH